MSSQKLVSITSHHISFNEYITMPMSKPVKKQQLLLPSPKDFNLLDKDKKMNILQRLSTDNLIIYFEYIVASFHTPTKTESFTLEQIVEDDISFDSNYLDEDSFIAEWIAKNANRSTDLEASLLEQSSSTYSMASAKAITETLLGSPITVADLTKRKNEGRVGKPFQDLTNSAVFDNANLNSPQKQFEDILSNSSYAAAVNLNTSGRNAHIKNAGDNISQSAGMSPRWQTNLALGKKSGAQFKATIERPSNGMDLRFGNESLLNMSSPAYFSKSNSTSFSKLLAKASLAHSHYHHDAFMSSCDENLINFGDKSSYSQCMGKSSFYSDPFDNSMQGSSSFVNTTFSPGTSSRNRSNFGSSLLMPASKNNGSFYKPDQGLHSEMYSQFDSLYTKSPRKSTSEFFGDSTKRFDTSFSKPAVDPIKNLASIISDDLKDSDLLAAFNLPEPKVFNELPTDSRAKIISSLPDAVKNKYEYSCWSQKITQLYNERPNGMNISS